jgi:hypothetical protein
MDEIGDGTTTIAVDDEIGGGGLPDSVKSPIVTVAESSI